MIGVFTRRRFARRMTPPSSASTSSGLPCSRSMSSDDRTVGSSESTYFTIRETVVFARRTRSAVATASTSLNAAIINSRVLASDQSGPIGWRAEPVKPANGAR